MNEKNNSLRKDLIRRIKSQVGWVIYDSLSFLFLKTKYNGAIPTIFGGGNIMMANSAFSALNYLSKVNYILRTSEEDFTDITPFITTEGENNSKNCYKELDGQAQKLLVSKRKWQMNESVAFEKLIHDLDNCDITIGLDLDDAKSEWTNFRNYLTHMNYPEGFVVTYNNLVPEKTISRGHEAVYQELLKSKRNSFSKFFAASGSGEYRYGFNVEIFIFRDLSIIREYIINKVAETDDFHLTKLDEWELHPRSNVN